MTRTQMVPAHFVRILETEWQRYDTSSIRLLLHAAAMCPVPLKWRILEVFPRGTVWELYGATEAMGTVISPGEWIMKPGSVGRPFPGLSIRILDENGRTPSSGRGRDHLREPVHRSELQVPGRQREDPRRPIRTAT